MASDQLHEPADVLRPETIEMHRAITSLIEELEAVDWYAQRVDASRDESLRGVLSHNRDEEKEHACMALEWIRRQDPTFDRLLRRILFRDGPIAAEASADDTRASDLAAALPERYHPQPAYDNIHTHRGGRGNSRGVGMVGGKRTADETVIIDDIAITQA